MGDTAGKEDSKESDAESDDDFDEDFIVETQSSSSEDDMCSDEDRRIQGPLQKRSKFVDIKRQLNDDNETGWYQERINELNMGNQNANLKSIKDNWKLDRDTWNQLYDYQKEGIKWLQMKYDQNVGGILADEMGLGKTIQTICFIRSLHESNLLFQPLNCLGLEKALVLCPASVMKQWIDEFNKWFPKCRVFILHATSSSGVNAKNIFEKLDKKRLEHPDGAVLITTYSMFRKYEKEINSKIWQVAFLDEGHKIKNSRSQVGQATSKIATPNRFILTGSPIQNNLAELWTLINFVYPGKLGSFDSFNDKIIKPITAGSFLTAKPQQREIAYQCAIVLQEAVKPYILRRLKSDAKEKLELPEKTEQILFCKLSKWQRKVYEKYLKSEEVSKIFAGTLDSLVGLTKITHICNHPAIYEKFSPHDPQFGSYKQSGKMVVLMKLLKNWKKCKDNKVLVYTQKKSVIHMIKYFLDLKSYNTIVMTGETAVGSRHVLVEKFKTDPDTFIFLMTTRVGGLGLNLTCANKIVIFDPDWNPTNDNQAKERAWRIGQTRDVTIYRLITQGTLEEKIYLRQVHKESLAMKILENSNGREVLSKETIRDLFRLVPEGVKGTEIGLHVTGEIVPRDEPRNETGEGSSESDRTKRKVKKRKLEKFEDRKVLSSLFDGEALQSIISHEQVVRDEQEKMVLKINAKQYALDAAKILIQREGRPSKDWEQHLINELPKSTKRIHNFVEQNEPENSFWASVNNTFGGRNKDRELNKRVSMAKDLRLLFIKKDFEMKTEEIDAYFKPEQMIGIDAYFFKEMLNTIAKLSSSEKSWKLRSKYR